MASWEFSFTGSQKNAWPIFRITCIDETLEALLLTLYQTTDFRLSQTEIVCRQRF